MCAVRSPMRRLLRFSSCPGNCMFSGSFEDAKKLLSEFAEQAEESWTGDKLVKTSSNEILDGNLLASNEDTEVETNYPNDQWEKRLEKAERLIKELTEEGCKLRAECDNVKRQQKEQDCRGATACLRRDVEVLKKQFEPKPLPRVTTTPAPVSSDVEEGEEGEWQEDEVFH